MKQQLVNHFLQSSFKTLLSIGEIKQDSRFHAFNGATDSITGYYQLDAGGSCGSFTVDFFNGQCEGVGTFTFTLKSTEAVQ